MSLLDQAIERLEDQFFALANEIEDLVAEDEEAAVDPDFRFLARTKLLDRALAVEFGEMESEGRMNCNEAADLSAFAKRSIMSGSGASVRPSL